jgi:ribosomal protein L11 methyltransferase
MRYKSVKFAIAISPDTSDIDIQTCRDLLAALLGDIGFESFEDTEKGLTGYIVSDDFDTLKLEEQISFFPLPAVLITYEIEDVEDRDWNTVWEETGFSPIIIGDRCAIHDSKHLPPSPYPIDITIEASQSFGTGTHATTRMIATELLDKDLTGCRVLDCGCGTGILSLLSKRLGAKEVVAYDIDEWSVNNTRHNMAINDIEGIEVLLGDSRVLSHVSGLFDYVLANINRNVLLADMPHFKEVLRAGGRLILSGFYEQDASLLIQSASSIGMTLSRSVLSGDWCMLVFSSSST